MNFKKLLRLFVLGKQLYMSVRSRVYQELHYYINKKRLKQILEKEEKIKRKNKEEKKLKNKENTTEVLEKTEK